MRVIPPITITDSGGTFTRASTGTYVAQDRTLQTAAIDTPRIDWTTGTGMLLLEPQATNYATYSQDFGNAVWTKSALTVQTDTDVGPFGTTTADKLVPTTANAVHYLSRQYAVTAGNPYTWTRYFKANGYSALHVRLSDALQYQGDISIAAGGKWLGVAANEMAARGDNLLLYPEELDNAVWQKGFLTVSQNTALARDGTTTADTITTAAASHNLNQTVTVVPGQMYAFSFDVQRGTMTDLKYSVYNNTALTDIIPATSYYAQTNAAGPTRVTVTFTAPAGCTQVRLYPLRDSGVTGTVILSQVKLNQVGALSSTYSGSPELVTNGAFATNLSGWTTAGAGNATWDAGNGGRLAIYDVAGNGANANQQLTTAANKVYAVTIQTSGGPVNVRVGTTAGGTNLLAMTQLSAGTTVLFFAATGAASNLMFSSVSSTASYVEDVSCKEVTTVATPYVPYSQIAGWVYQNTTDSKYYSLNATYGQTEAYSPYDRIAVFDLSSGKVVSSDSSKGITANIQNVGSGYYRISISGMATGTGSGSVYTAVMQDATAAPVLLPAFAGDGVSGVLAWQEDFIDGLVVLSPIPTDASPVTRAADVVTGNGLLFSSVAEPAPGEQAYSATATYLSGNVVINPTTHRQYTSLLGAQATVTLSLANPCVVTWPAHGLVSGMPVVLATTGALPSTLSAGTTYYALVTGSDTFNLAATAGGTAINTSGLSQSGTHTATTNGNKGHALPVPPLTQNDWWKETGVSNKWAAFDLKRNSQSIGGTSITKIIRPGVRANSLAVLGMVGDSISVSAFSGGVQVYSSYKSLVTRTVKNAYDYCFGGFTLIPSFVAFDLPLFSDLVICVTVTSASGGAAIGSLVAGMSVYLGQAQYRAVSSALNFSKVDRDDQGNTTLIPVRRVPKTSQTLIIDKDQVGAAYDASYALDAVPCVWCALDDTTDAYFKILLILGIYKQFDIDAEGPGHAIITLELEEI